jgi:hypothetical protein
VSSALQRSEKCTTGLSKDQRTHTVPLGIIHQQLTTFNGAIHKKGSEYNSQFTHWQRFFYFALITTKTSTLLFLHHQMHAS